MSDYENIVISAVRYALGRMTYIVDLTVKYVIREIEEDKLSDYCLQIIRADIIGTKDLGMYCDETAWFNLLEKINKKLNIVND